MFNTADTECNTADLKVWGNIPTKLCLYHGSVSFQILVLLSQYCCEESPVISFVVSILEILMSGCWVYWNAILLFVSFWTFSVLILLLKYVVCKFDPPTLLSTLPFQSCPCNAKCKNVVKKFKIPSFYCVKVKWVSFNSTNTGQPSLGEICKSQSFCENP